LLQGVLGLLSQLVDAEHWVSQETAGQAPKMVSLPQTTIYIDATLTRAIRYTVVSILICRGLAVSFLTRVTVSTPLL
jgi:hypothetical protein